MNLSTETYTDEGAGATLLLLHGFCEDRSIFNGLVDGLRPSFRLVAPDMPGHAGLPWKSDLKSISDLADWLIRFADQLKIEQFHLLGHSLGGYIAADLASRYPARLLSLAMLHSTALADTPQVQQRRNRIIELLRSKGKATYLPMFIQGLFFKPEAAWIQELERITAKADLEAIVGLMQIMRDRTDRLEDLKKTGLPVSYIMGEYDTLVPPNRSQSELENWPEARPEILKGVGHMAMYEDPKNLLRLLKEHLHSV